VSAAQFLRDCALLRLGQLSALRGDAAAQVTIEQLAARSLSEQRRYAGSAADARLSDEQRLAALSRTELLDQPVDAGLNQLVDLAAQVLHVPTVLVSLVDTDRQFFAAQCGLGEPWASSRETGMSHSFCREVVVSRQPFVVSDAREHPSVRDNLAIRDLGVVAYAGMPLTVGDDQIVGSFCAIDTEPRVWTRAELDVLAGFANSASAYIENRSR
jgi:GAF domain-containing protein